MQIKDLLKSTSIYSLNEVVKKGVVFLLFPLFTRLLSEEDFGIWGVYISISMFVAPLVGLGSNASLNRHFWDLTKDELRSYLGNVYFITFSLGFLFIILTFLFSDPFSKWLNIPIYALYAALILGIVQFTVTISLSLFQLRDQPLAYSIVSIGNVVLAYLFAGLLIIYYQANWESYVYGYLIGACLITFFVMIFTIKKERIIFFSFREHLKPIIDYGLKFIFAAFSVWVINMSDKLFITHMLSLSDTGLYTIGYSFGSLILLLNTAFSRGWLPYFYNKVKSSNHHDKIELIRVTYAYWVVLFASALLVSYIGPFILEILVDRKFHGGTVFISWVAFGYAFNGVTKSLESFLHYQKRPGLISIINGGLAILNLFMNYLLIDSLGVLGASISTLITFLIGFVITFAVVLVKMDLPWLDSIINIYVKKTN